MMNKLLQKVGILCLFLALSLTAPCIASSQYDQSLHYPPLEIEIISDQGEAYSTYPVTQSYLKKEYRTYLEAIRGKNYSLRIHNHTNKRLGLVIAVDGRNIISGKKSRLKYNENMYILGPHETQVYSGWRTSSKDIHRFYFTDMEDSYAHAFDDESAMGVIAVAAFEEKQAWINKRENILKSKPQTKSKTSQRSHGSSTNESTTMDKAESETGTGFGEHETSHVRRVYFNAKNNPLSKNFYKYEWRETLCNKRIINCKPELNNRFWPHDYELGYVPYPPNYK